MRAIDPRLQNRLDGGATTLCRCWRLVRSDGHTIGFTDHDRDLVFDGVTFEAASGLTAAALQHSTGLSVDNTEAVGALQAAGLTERDIVAGRYDGARVDQWIVDWTDPVLRVRVFTGTIGEIVRRDGAFTAELRGRAESLNRVVGRAYLRDCDARLGDARCGVDLGDPVYGADIAVVRVIDGARVAVSGLGGYAAGWFRFGELRWLSGANAGLSVRLRSDTAGAERVLETWEQAVASVEPGDVARVTAGCDRTAETCRMKFNNLMRFRGFPHIPGEDWLNGYVREGERHDGSSLFR